MLKENEHFKAGCSVPAQGDETGHPIKTLLPNALAVFFLLILEQQVI